MPQADVLQKLFRTHARPLSEQALKVERTQTNLFGHFVERGLRFEVLMEVGNGLRYALVVEVGFHGFIFGVG